MRVFIAGSSGVLGRATVRQLCARGHQPVGLVRSEEKARVVRALGAEPIVGDIFDPDFVRRAVKGADVVMHLATAIPKKARPRARDWEMNDRLRRAGTRNLIEAARGQKVRAFIQQSVAFLYGDRRGDWLSEDAQPRSARNLQSVLDAEQMVLAAYDEFGLPGVVLRGATFYGPDCWHTRAMINAVKWRLMPILGSGEQYWHYVYVEDMAGACVRAAENPAPGEIFFVADDWPFHARDFLNYLAAQLNAPAPFRTTVALGRILLGPQAVQLAQSARYRTDKIKKMIGWTPRYPTYREGCAEILPRLGTTPK
jgi:nucleoside-diphosphate-sugar epimerase